MLSTRRSRRIAVCCWVLTVLGWPGSAEAAFPGANGQLAYGDVIRTGSCEIRIDCFDERVRFFSPRTGRGRTFPTCADERCDDEDPVWSPDGRRLVFIRSTFGGSGAIVVARPNGTIISERAPAVSEPAWSPDGRRFALGIDRNFAGRCCGATEADIFSTNIDGSAERRLTFRGGRSPRWSVRGVIAYARRGRRPDPRLGYPVTELFTVRSGGGKSRRITFGGGDSPDWSPDGKRLVAVRDYGSRSAEDGNEIVIINPRTRKIRRLTYLGGILPTWSPDGTKIAFVRANQLVVVDLTRRSKRVFKVNSHDIGYLDWQAITSEPR